VADWVTISSLATAGGTLVLAAATFASVRSANRSARASEQALSAGLRPLLVSSNGFGWRAAGCPSVLGHERMTLDVLYGDFAGGHRVVTRIGLVPRGDDGWLSATARHRNIDRPDPR
jgi:hypothetical protein